MAHTKAGGSTKLGRDSRSKRLGVKISDGQAVRPGMIIIRQKGSKYLAGDNVKTGCDDTIFSLKEGKVKFTITRKKKFDGSLRTASKVSVI